MKNIATKPKTIQSKYWFIFILLLFSSVLHTSACAKTVVLIHGYLASSHEWRNRSIITEFSKKRWINAGNYNEYLQQMITPDPEKIKLKRNIVVTVDLPSYAAIETQANILARYLAHLWQKRKEPLILVGHSAGGVVARAYAIRPRSVPIKAIISIVSPHLGTPLADLALFASQTPIDEMLNITGLSQLLKQEAVLRDLKVESTKGYLHWLNNQPHPKISYISITRTNKDFANADMVVPLHSQDMNNIVALRNQAIKVPTEGNHFLNPGDAVTLLKVIQWLK